MRQKILLLVLILLLGILLVAPWFVGAGLEQWHKASLQRLAAPGGIVLGESRFERGWLKSTVRDTLVRSGAACLGGSCEPLTVETVIYHGPVPLLGILDGKAPLHPVRGVAVSRLNLGPLLPQGAVNPALPPLEAVSVVQLDGATRTRLSMPASRHSVKTQKEGELQLRLGGLDGRFDVAAASTRVSGELSFSALSLEGTDGRVLKLEGVGVTVDGASEDSLFIGKIQERVELLAMREGAAPMTELRGISVNLDSRKQGAELMSSGFELGLKTLNSLGREYGPVTLQGEIRGLHRGAMNALQQELKAAQAQTDPQQMLAGVMQAYQKHLPVILKAKPELDISRLSLTTPEGEVLASLKLSAAESAGEAGFAALPQLLQLELSLQIPAVTLWNLFDARLQRAALLQAGRSDAEPVLPPQDAIGAEVTRLVQANVLVPKLEANAYVLQASLRQGQLSLNGQPAGDLGSLMGLLAGLFGAGQPPAAAPAPTP